MSAFLVAAGGIVVLIGLFLGSGTPARPNPASLTVSSAANELRQATYGPSRLECPQPSIRIRRGQDIQAAIDAAPHSSTFCIEAGEYRLAQTLHPKYKDSLLFEPGASLNGSKIVAAWAFDGTYWVAAGQTQSFPNLDFPCEVNPVACEYEDLFRDDQPMERVLELSDVVPGKFFFDEENDKMYLKDNPTGHKLEATVTGTAIDTLDAGPAVTIRGAIIEKFAYDGIVIRLTGTVAQNDIRYCHSHGLKTGLDVHVIGNKIHHNGMAGIFGAGERSRFERNEISYNNAQNFGKRVGGYWTAGAAKIMLSKATVVRNNWSHHNRGDGWWFDTDNIDNQVQGNLFEDNARWGLFYEVSERGVVRDNVFNRNTEGGLWVNNSRDLEVTGNTFDSNGGYTIGLVAYTRERSPTYGEHQLANIFVHNNLIKMNRGQVGTAPGDYRNVRSGSNRFESNSYRVSHPGLKWWTWAGEGMTWSQWRAEGHDRSGEVERMPQGRGE